MFINPLDAMTMKSKLIMLTAYTYGRKIDWSILMHIIGRIITDASYDYKVHNVIWA
jgi:hypothetical protein